MAGENYLKQNNKVVGEYLMLLQETRKNAAKFKVLNLFQTKKRLYLIQNNNDKVASHFRKKTKFQFSNNIPQFV